jgi:hypothetical protein
MSTTEWRKSSRSGGLDGGGNECVEVAALSDGRIAVRDSKHPDGAIAFFTRHPARRLDQADHRRRGSVNAYGGFGLLHQRSPRRGPR